MCLFEERPRLEADLFDVPGITRHDRGPMRRGNPRRTCAVVALAVLLTLVACTDTTQPSFVAGMRISPEYTGAAVGETIVLEAMPLGENDEPLPDRAERVQFRVSDPSVASIESMGDGRVAVTGLQLGNTSIRAELGRGTGSALMFVQPPGLDRLEIQPSAVTIDRPGGASLRVILLDAQGVPMSDNGFTFKWTTSDPGVASFIYDYTNPLGVQARGPGTATLTVRVGAESATATVTVR